MATTLLFPPPERRMQINVLAAYKELNDQHRNGVLVFRLDDDDRDVETIRKVNDDAYAVTFMDGSKPRAVLKSIKVRVLRKDCVQV